MAKNGSYSYNAQGHTDPETGEVKDHNGNVVPVGLDEQARKSLQEQLDGPKVRVMPSERELLAGTATFTTTPKPLEYEDSLQSGGKEDVEKASSGKPAKAAAK